MGLLDSITDRLVGYGQGVVARVMAPTMTAAAREMEQHERLYQGEQYQGRGLADPWDKQRPGAKVPLRNQRPSVQYDLPRPIVDRPTALLFGEGRFPDVLFESAEPPPAAGDDAAREAREAEVAAVNAWLAAIVDEGALEPVALTWARQGVRLGAGALTWSVCEGEFEFEAHSALTTKPTFHPRKRDRLVRLEKRYKFTRAVEEIQAGALVSVERPFWHREEWDETAHTVYVDALVGDGKEPAWKVADRVEHRLGICPAVWCKSVDDGEHGPVGKSLLDGIGDMVEDIDRTLTQKSRAVRYNQEPERVLFGLKDEDKNKVEVAGGGATRALPSRKDGGDALLLELKGEGQKVAEEHIVAQRGRTLEVTRVVLPDAERLLAAASSGAALRVLFGPMLELVGELRQSFGRALRRMFAQILDAARSGRLKALGRLATPPPARVPAGKVALLWGDYFEPTPQDLKTLADTARTLVEAGLFDRDTLVRYLASYFGVRDVRAVLAALDAAAAAKVPAAPPR
ncbi:MAG: hypothetical protein JWM10_999, partial [Myxococcaceae bacterium]|nr:hypothetical protein [Myxococcaceae bacterium]